MGIISKAIKSPKMETNYIGAPSFRYKNPGYNFLDCIDDYASIYPSVRSITNEFMKIRPYAVDSNGKPRQNTPVINALYHPNQTDSSVAFFEKLSVMALTHRMTYLLVWRREGRETHPGGDITPFNIAGFTFLENPSISIRDKTTYYSIGAQTFTENEVISIPGGVDPSNLYIGYAPGVASRKWATLDDYIADYQSGFFENGAVPAGQFIITAASVKDYEDTVAKMQSSHRGAGKNNNVTYAPRPIDPVTGKPGESKIEWIPFASNNKDIDFKNLFDQANKRIDSAYGVPASVRGVGESNNYATARVDQQNFIRFAVDPLALRIYTQITHELNRITGGLGVAITYDIELPAVADEEKVQAETKSIEVRMINDLMAQGFTLDSAVDALKLSPSYKLLEISESTETVIENDKPEVDDGDEVADSPDPDKIDGVTPINKSTIKPKNQLTESDEELFEDQLAIVIRQNMQSQIDKSISELSANNQITQEDIDAMTDDMMVVIISSMIASGELQYTQGITLLVENGISIDNLTNFNLTQTQQSTYREYLSNVAQSYTSDTATSIRNVLDRANTQGFNRSETEAALRNIMNTDEWRVQRLARSEINRSEQMGGFHSMQQIKEEADVELTKTWNVRDSNACEFCLALDGKTIGINETFLGENDSLTGIEGGTFLNTFVPVEASEIHPNGRCFITYGVVS